MKAKKILLNILPLLIIGGAMVYAAAPIGGYQPGDTLDPDCTPGSTDCFVQLPDFSVMTGLPSGTTDSVATGSLEGAMCITNSGNLYIDTDGTCAN